MIYGRIKKAIVSLALAAGFVLSAGIVGGSLTEANAADSRAQNRRAEQRHRQWDRRHEREAFERARRFDRDRRVRYRYNRSIRIVGYLDRFGRFHAVGFFDRFGRFHRY